MKNKLSTRSFGDVLAAAVLALLVVAGLSLLLSHLQVRAEPARELPAADALAAQQVLTPTSQTRSPEKGALISREGVVAIEGLAWFGDNRPPFPGDPTLLPIENGGEPNYVVDWTEPTAGEFYILYESDDPYFEDPTTYDTGQESQKFISGQPAGTYYYRVKSYNTGGASRYSNIESVTVGSGAGALIGESTGLAAQESITVWVRIDAGTWHAADVTETTQGGWQGWAWSYDWDLPEDERYQEHTIETRASAEGEYGPTDTISVTVNNQIYYAYLPIIAKRWPPIPYAPDLARISNPDRRVSYTLNWSYDDNEPDVPDPTSYTLQEDTNPNFTDPVVHTDIGSEQFTITDPDHEKTGGTYYYRVRGHNTYGAGEWSVVRSTLVRVLPYAPTLQTIDNADRDDSYTVEWSYGHAYPQVNTFVLQEATNPSFSGAQTYQLSGATTSRQFTDKGSQRYYYRVKGRNEYGDGPWSTGESVEAVSADFFDNFSDPGSGWMTHDAACCLSGCDDGTLQQHPNYKYDLFYDSGRYHVRIPLDCRAGGNHGDTRHIYPLVFAPNTERPLSRTCLEAKGTFERWDPYWSFWGLVFAASDDKSTVWSLEVNNLGDWAVVKRTGYDFPGPNAPYVNEERIYEEAYTGGHRDPAEAAYEPNTLRAEVDGRRVKLYINGQKVHEFSDPEIRSLTEVGLIGGNWEITPTQIGYSYFLIDEGCDDY